ncbi:MAG TPA: AraC family transcriptional regulator [Candidatus Dormibacteraeota bacterium]|nr:AraC family transcriptional regulator [Candidatus Dormibacteraeota bacterium]
MIRGHAAGGSTLTVSAGLARGLIELAVSRGARRDALLEASGIRLAELTDQDNRILLARYIALMRAGKELSHDPALALHFGEINDLSDISVVGLIGNASANMLEALEQLNRYGRLVVEFAGPKDRFLLTRKQGKLWLVDARDSPNEFPELTESTFARMVCTPRRFGIDNWAEEIHVTHSAPSYRSEYDRVLGVPVTFDTEWNAIRANEAALSHPIAREPHYAFGILARHADTLLANLESSRSVRGEVERLLISMLHTGDVGIDAVANRMSVSRQTLFRKLKAEGTTFEHTLDDLRHMLAVEYLDGKKVSVNETAYLLGFSEPAAFSHAFKRWTGRSPRHRT